MTDDDDDLSPADRRVAARIADLPLDEPAPGWEDRAVERWRRHDSIREFVTARLASIEARPAMWGSTREAVGLQIVLLVEVWHLEHGRPFAQDRAMVAVFGPGPSVEGDVTDEWARGAVDAVRAMIAERTIQQT